MLQAGGVDMGVVEDLAVAAEAYRAGDWRAAFDATAGHDLAQLDLDALERAGVASYLVGEMDEAVRCLTEAFHRQSAAGDAVGAARSALTMALTLNTTGRSTIGMGWVARAERILDEIDDDVVERGWVLLHQMYQHLAQHDYEQAHRCAVEYTTVGRRFRDADLVALGLSSQGRFLLATGEVPAGLQLFDEAMVAVAAGECSPVVAGNVYCTMIEGCQELGDLGRAADWTAALTRWCDQQPGLVPFVGQCAVHRAQMLRAHGAFTDALAELDQAARRYSRAGNPEPIALVMRERGDVLSVLGDFDGARSSYESAAAGGCDPQPGQALLWLAQGRAEAAMATLRRLLDAPTGPVERSRLLPAAVVVCCATDQLEEATAAAEELTGLAASFGCPAVLARAAGARGRVALVTGRPADAAAEAHEAMRLWLAGDAAYDVALARVLLGRALRALGDEESAARELGTARAELSRLGATPDLRDLDALAGSALPGGLSEREAQVLRLVAAGKSNSEIAADLVLSHKTVARHLSNIFTKLDVGSRTAAAAFAHQHHLV
jgi:DNA-binding NarL/FixJ family response regulator